MGVQLYHDQARKHERCKVTIWYSPADYTANAV